MVVFNWDKVVTDRWPRLVVSKISDEWNGRTMVTGVQKKLQTGGCGEMCGEFEMTRDPIVACSIRFNDYLFEDSVRVTMMAY